MRDRDYYNCVFPEKRPPNVWQVYDTNTPREWLGEVAAQSESEARIKVSQQISFPFILDHTEE